MKNRIWVVGVLLLFLASCQSSRFMQDDLYFTDMDAKREVRENLNNSTTNSTNANSDEEVKSNFKLNKDNSDILITNTYYTDKDFTYDDYYDYSYSSRIRRFQRPNSTWGYYDPYFTNYYWYNNSNPSYFGNSVYATYTWWGPNFGNNYSDYYWGNNYYGYGSWGNGWYGNNWCNPWQNNMYGNNWWNPYNPYACNGWNNSCYGNNGYWNGFGSISYGNMYYNSYDNNCYVWRANHANAPATSGPTNFSILMQNNGISHDVVQRPAINYTAIRESYQSSIDNKNNNSTNANTVTDNKENNPVVTDNTNNGAVVSGNKNNSPTNNNTIVITNYDNNDNSNKYNNANSGTTNSGNNSNANTNTNRRWDNYNSDVNISPNTNNNNSNWSRSGVFSEGSRNNNYEYKGSTMPNTNPDRKVNTTPNNAGTQRGKSPN